MVKLTLLVALCLALGLNVLDCGIKETSSADDVTTLVPEVKTIFPTIPVRDECKPKDCAEILRRGQNSNGVYTIWPMNRLFLRKSLQVYCDMVTDGGGWTVIQRRGQFSTPKDYFYNDWQEYKLGFGILTEEFWLGNDNIFALSNQADSMIRFDLRDAKGKVGYAKYTTFWIDDENNFYTLHIKDYVGDVGDAMTRHNNLKFTTKDRDNDKNKNGNCAVERKGAWWYDNCSASSLNGLNQPGVNSREGIQWNTWRQDVSLAGVEIKIRPK